MKSKHLTAVLATVVALTTVTACGTTSGTNNTTSTPPSGGSGATTTTTLNIGLSADPPKLDPSLSSALVDREVMINIYDTLLQLGSDNQIKPDLAKTYTVSPDGKTYTFTLQQGVTFQDGTPFNAAAVKFNLERDMTKLSPRHSGLAAIASIDAPDDSTVVIHLKTPFSPLLSILTGRTGMMVSPTAVQKEGKDFVNNPVGTGPFQFKERVKGDHITLVKNSHYWQSGEPKFDTLTYKIFTDPNVEYMNLQSGAVQIVDAVPAQQLQSLAQNSAYTVVNKSGFGYQGIWLNVKSGPFTNQYLREAVDVAINRQTVVDVVLKGEGTPGYSPFSASSPAYNASEDTPPTPDAAKVKQLLTQGGQPNGFSFTMQIAASPVTAQMAQVIQSMLGQYGIKMEIQQLEFGTLLANSENGGFQALQLGWSGRLDPDQNIYSFFYTNGPLNSANFSNPQVDQLLDKARAESTMEQRAQTYAQVMDILHQQAPYVFLYHQHNVIAYTNKLQGFDYVSDGLIRAGNLSMK